MEVIFIVVIAVFFIIAAARKKKVKTENQHKDASITIHQKDNINLDVVNKAYESARKREHKATVEKTDIPTTTHSTSVIESASNASPSDDGLATFNIFEDSSYKELTFTGGKVGQWLGKDKVAKVQGRVLKHFLYVGGRMESLRGHHAEPALINSNLQASKPRGPEKFTDFYTDESLGYWPSYSHLSRDCRGSYLDWLATDRNAHNTPIGFVFLYFYGFERFVIGNSKNPKVEGIEYEQIFDEVLRLNTTFNHNRSFASYSANFLELMYLTMPELFEHRKSELPKTRHSLLFKIRLAEQVTESQKVDAELALEWIKNNELYRPKTAARRCENEFDTLFKMYFSKKYPEGMPVKPNKTKLSAAYQPASGGIPTATIVLGGLPDPSILKGPINKLIPFAEKCCDELAGYSRYLGKADTSKNDLPALMLLPPALAAEQSSPLLDKFKEWANDIITNHDGVADVGEFWSQTGLPIPKAINKKESELIYSLANFADVGVAPDLRYHHAKLKFDGKIVLLSPAHESDFSPSHAFNKTGVALRLGAMVATIDGHVDESEKIALQQLIEQEDKLNPTEKRSLHAYLKWRLVTSSDNAGLKARLEKLNASDTEFVKRFILSIALADGNIDNREVKQIEKLYTQIGLDKETVSSDIHQLTTTSHKTEAKESKSTASFVLDEAILAAHEHDTSQAKSMLEEIFTSEDDEPESAEGDINISSNVENGLDEPHNKLFEKLCTKEQWSRNEVAECCTELNLMIDGAIETINDWSFDLVDAPVIEDDGDIYVDQEIVEEIRELEQ